jgi:hypothetical protein
MSMSRRSVFGLAGAGLAAGAAQALPAPRGIRISSVETDPGYAEWQEFLMTRGTPHIYLNGVKQKLVETADEEMGLVVNFIADGERDIKLNAASDEPLRETLRGTVRIMGSEDGKSCC